MLLSLLFGVNVVSHSSEVIDAALGLVFVDQDGSVLLCSQSLNRSFGLHRVVINFLSKDLHPLGA